MALYELRLQLEPPGGNELGAPEDWEQQHLRPGSHVVMQEGESAGEIGRVIGRSWEDVDCVEIELTHRQKRTTRIVRTAETQPVPGRLFEVLEEMFGEMLTRQQDPEGRRLGTGRYDGFRKYYTLYLPEPPALHQWETARVDMVAERLGEQLQANLQSENLATGRCRHLPSARGGPPKKGLTKNTY